MPDFLGGFEHTWPFYAALVIGYLLGSIPFGLVLTRLAGQGDIRDIGSGNIGATNVLRTGKKGLAAATLFCDVAKGAVPVLLAGIYGQDMAVMAAAGAILGHILPIWLKFKGGKGVATAFGILLAIAWPVALLCGAVWLLVALLLRYSSLASMLGAASAPAFAWWLEDPQIALLCGLIAALILIRHVGNIGRLVRGEESKIGKRESPDDH